MTGRLKGKVTVVTGAGRGIGRAIATDYAADATLLHGSPTAQSFSLIRRDV